MGSINQWNANLYDDKHAFVSEYGRGVIDLLDPQEGEKIIDLGCGTGDLTKEISLFGANVVGMDASADMLQKAREKFPEITFKQADASHFNMNQSYHAVFSNAVLHWIKKPTEVIESVYTALKPGGRFIAEFGGEGNVHILVQGILDVLKEEYNVEEQQAINRIPWYFPSIGQYCSLLETAGFRVTNAYHFDRPTILSDGESGLDHWLDNFAETFFPEFHKEERERIYKQIKDRTREKLFKDGNWVVDYKRLRIAAVK